MNNFEVLLFKTKWLIDEEMLQQKIEKIHIMHFQNLIELFEKMINCSPFELNYGLKYPMFRNQ